jgi:hypothetical protein
MARKQYEISEAQVEQMEKNEETVKDNETKDARFKRLAQKRLEKCIHDIGLLANLSNKSQYEYTDNQVAYILEKLNGAVSGVDSAFNKTETVKDAIVLPD